MSHFIFLSYFCLPAIDRRGAQQTTRVLFSDVRHVFLTEQVPQLSQRDRVAGWVSYGQKWKTVTGRQYFETL